MLDSDKPMALSSTVTTGAILHVPELGWAVRATLAKPWSGEGNVETPKYTGVTQSAESKTAPVDLASERNLWHRTVSG